MEREGFEPSKATPADLQSAPFGQLGNLSKTDILILSKDSSVVKGLSDVFLDIFFLGCKLFQLSWLLEKKEGRIFWNPAPNS